MQRKVSGRGDTLGLEAGLGLVCTGPEINLDTNWCLTGAFVHPHKVSKVKLSIFRLTALSTEKEKQGERKEGEESVGEAWWNREKERGERVGEEEEEDRLLDNQQSNGGEEEMEGEEQEQLEGARINDTRREALSKIKEKEEVQRVMKQMLRSLYGMLKHEREPESARRGFEMKVVRKHSNRGWIPEPKNTPLWIPNSKKLTLAKRNTVPMVG